jgi:integrase
MSQSRCHRGRSGVRECERESGLSAGTVALLNKVARADGPLFTDTEGGRLRNGNVTKRSSQPILKQAGLASRRLYDLRHTCATLLLAAGVNPKIVSERIGHSSVVLTLNTYSHVLPGMQDVAAMNMGHWLQLRGSNGTADESPASLDVVRQQFSDSVGLNTNGKPRDKRTWTDSSAGRAKD